MRKTEVIRWKLSTVWSPSLPTFPAAPPLGVCVHPAMALSFLLSQPGACLAPVPRPAFSTLHLADDGSGKTMFTVLSHLPLEVSCCSLPTKRLKPKKRQMQAVRGGPGQNPSPCCQSCSGEERERPSSQQSHQQQRLHRGGS